jgi:hypothetical protein
MIIKSGSPFRAAGASQRDAEGIRDIQRIRSKSGKKAMKKGPEDINSGLFSFALRFA